MSILLAIAAALAEGALWGAAALGLLPLVFALVLHTAVTGVLAAAAFTSRGERTALIVLAAGTFFMGPFGAAGGVAMMLIAAIPSRTDFAAYRRTLGPEGAEIFAAPQRVRPQTGRMLPSFNDVMRWGSRSEKQSVLRRIAERYSPVFAGALKVALHDPATEIRSEAGAATAAILKTLESRAKTLAAAAARGGAPALMAYGDAELAVADSTLASPQRSAEARKAALAAYGEALRAKPQLQAVHLKAAEALLASGAIMEAARESGAYLKVGGHSESALEIYLETLFALGRYGELRRVLAQVPVHGPARRAAALWRGRWTRQRQGMRRHG